MRRARSKPCAAGKSAAAEARPGMAAGGGGAVAGTGAKSKRQGERLHEPSPGLPRERRFYGACPVSVSFYGAGSIHPVG